METKIMPCVCKHKFQDEKYGKGNRVFLLSTKKSLGPEKKTYTCSVCGREKVKGADEK